MSSVAVRGVTKAYGPTKAVDDVSLDISDGEFVVLVGPSGCGKSTLLRMIAGLEEIDDGDVVINDVVVNDVPSKSRDIAMVFQSYALYPHMTVRENMAFALSLRNLPPADIRSKIDRVADILGLSGLLDRFPRQLSGGQRQRVAMGRAIVRDPKVFLFDEPLSNLDAKLRVQMRGEIKSLHNRLKTTTIYVTHDQVEAMTMADRVVVMRGGTVEQLGSPLELYDRPSNIFVAQFIGSPSMNILSGEVSRGLFTTADGLRLPLPAFASGFEGRRISYGIRPEQLLIDATGIAVLVEVTEPTGAETHLICRFGPQRLNAVLRERLDLAPGSTVNLLPHLAHVHLFDGEGERI
jgi:multiple sugar transport system ATP-binding protein